MANEDDQDRATAHSDETAPESTKDDATDAGVPMLAGDPSEPVGPEDALGVGLTRGDYRDRMDSSVHLESVPNPKAGEPIYGWQNEDGSPAKEGAKGATRFVSDYEPAYILVNQSARLDEIGDEPGLKGGVDTPPTDREADVNPAASTA